MKTEAERFWPKVDKLTTPDSCWIWTASKDKDGYGHFRMRNRLTSASRAAWELTYGTIPNGIEVCHSCDNPSCVRPDHLFLGTHTENNRDAIAKGRWLTLRGENNPKHKLTEDAVREIRNSPLSQWQLARKFGVSRWLIQRVRHNIVWKK